VLSDVNIMVVLGCFDSGIRRSSSRHVFGARNASTLSEAPRRKPPTEQLTLRPGRFR